MKSNLERELYQYQNSYPYSSNPYSEIFLMKSTYGSSILNNGQLKTIKKNLGIRFLSIAKTHRSFVIVNWRYSPNLDQKGWPISNIQMFAGFVVSEQQNILFVNGISIHFFNHCSSITSILITYISEIINGKGCQSFMQKTK